MTLEPMIVRIHGVTSYDDPRVPEGIVEVRTDNGLSLGYFAIATEDES